MSNKVFDKGMSAEFSGNLIDIISHQHAHLNKRNLHKKTTITTVMRTSLKKIFMVITMAFHVHFSSLYISNPFSWFSLK